MTLSAMDEYDIKCSFDALDDEKIHRISIESFYTMFLGLGFQPKQITLEQTRAKVALAIEKRIETFDAARTTTATTTTSSTTTAITTRVEDLELLEANVDSNNAILPLSLVLEILSQHSRQRPTDADWFRLVDVSNKGYITASDLQQLANEVGEPMTDMEANLLLSSSTTTDDQKMTLPEFTKLFAPPSP